MFYEGAITDIQKLLHINREWSHTFKFFPVFINCLTTRASTVIIVVAYTIQIEADSCMLGKLVRMR